MFDIGFSELLVIGVVALIVIGPEKLPRVARTVGVLAGRLQRYVADVKADINREIELEELRKMRDSMQQAASDFQSSVQSEVSKTEAELNQTAAELNKAVEDVAKDPSESTSAESKPAASKPEETKPAA
ncbi:MAG TPA: Sec-independent protein translocase protein TatB [Burkholderiales bacterium]|jgi:sec-independent protein translocase protein TatB